MSVAERIKQIRASLGDTQAAMAARLRIGLRTYSSYEGGERLPLAETLQALSEMGFNINWLLTGSGTMLNIDPSLDQFTEAQVLAALQSLDVEQRMVEDQFRCDGPGGIEHGMHSRAIPERRSALSARLRQLQGEHVIDPTCGSGGFLVQAVLDAELNARVVEAVSGVYAETGAKIAPRDLGRVTAEIYNDIAAAGIESWEEKMGALRLATGQLRRRLVAPAAPNPGSAQGKRLA